jgi:hypothetical protein
MKKAIFITALFFSISLNSFSQDENIPLPDFVNSLYLITNDGLVKLEKQESKVNYKVKAATYIPYANLFAGGVKGNLIIKSAKSTVRLNSNKLRFILQPEVMEDPSTYIKIITFKSNTKKNQREFFTGSANIWGDEKINELEKIPFTFKKYKDKYLLIEINSISRGEYGIMFNVKDNLNAELIIQLFGID